MPKIQGTIRFHENGFAQLVLASGQYSLIRLGALQEANKKNDCDSLFPQGLKISNVGDRSFKVSTLPSLRAINRALDSTARDLKSLGFKDGMLLSVSGCKCNIHFGHGPVNRILYSRRLNSPDES